MDAYTPIIATRWFLYGTTLGLGILVLMGVYIHFDPRATDGLSFGEMTVIEKAGFIYIVPSVVSMIGAAWVHAFSNQVKVWRWLTIVAWPCSFVYAWRVYLRTKRERQSKADFASRRPRLP